MSTPELRQYQTEALNFLLSHRRSVLAYAAGSGKTPICLAALRETGARRVLIVAPKSVCRHWADLAEIWWPMLRVFIGTGSAAQRQDARMVVSDNRPAALVINYEAMRADVDELAKITWDAVVFDEAHRLKNRTTQQTRAANALTRRPDQWVWMATGTPIQNRPEEIWSLLHIIDRHRYSSYWAWVRAYYQTSMASYGWGARRQQVEQLGDLHDGAIEKMRSELADVMIHKPLDELLPDLPEVTYVTVDVELDAAERALYDRLRKGWWAEVGGDILLIKSEVSRITRLRQIVSDVGILDVGRDRLGSKIAATVELCDDLAPEQVVVLTWSRAAAERVAAGVDGEYIHGDVSTDERSRIIADFAAGRIRVLAGTLATLGEGVDGLQVARHLIRLDRDWVPAKNLQSVARLRRSGQKNAVVVYDIVAHRTIDAAVERALRNKEDVIEAVLSSGM